MLSLAFFSPFFSTPTGLEDVSRYPDLLAELLEDPNWTEDDIKKLAGENLLRAFAKVEEVSWRIAEIALLHVPKKIYRGIRKAAKRSRNYHLDNAKKVSVILFFIRVSIFTRQPRCFVLWALRGKARSTIFIASFFTKCSAEFRDWAFFLVWGTLDFRIARMHFIERF